MKDSASFQDARDTLKRNISNLFASCLPIRDPRRVEAFTSIYSLMRVIDDLSDDIAFEWENSLSVEAGLEEIQQWEESIRFCYQGDARASSIDLRVARSISQFDIPWRVWEIFFNAMKMRLNCAGFATIERLEQFAMGSAVVPMEIFLTIVFSEPDTQGVYVVPKSLKVSDIATYTGIWSFMIHLLTIAGRYLTYNQPRNLFPLDLMADCEVDMATLIRDARSGHCSPEVVALVKQILHRAEVWGEGGLPDLAEASRGVSPDRRRAVESYVGIYREITRRVAAAEYCIFRPEPLWQPSDRDEFIRGIPGGGRK